RVATETVTFAGENSTSGTGTPFASTATRRATPPPTAGAKASTRATRSSDWVRPVSVTEAGSADAVASMPAGRSPVSATVTASVEVVIVSRKPITSAGSMRCTLMSCGACTLTCAVNSPLSPVRSGYALSISGVSRSPRRLGPLTDTATESGRPTGTKPSSTPSTLSGRNMLRSVSEALELVTNSQIRKAITTEASFGTQLRARRCSRALSVAARPVTAGPPAARPRSPAPGRAAPRPGGSRVGLLEHREDLRRRDVGAELAGARHAHRPALLADDDHDRVRDLREAQRRAVPRAVLHRPALVPVGEGEDRAGVGDHVLLDHHAAVVQRPGRGEQRLQERGRDRRADGRARLAVLLQRRALL